MRKLPLIILSIVILIAVLVLLPFSPSIVHAVKNRFQPATNSNARSSSIITSPSKENLSEPLISRDVPIFASSEVYPASNANDDNYNTTWRSHGAPAWLAYDLSSVPIAKRSNVLVAWYNDTGNYNVGRVAYNMPQDYTIDGNSATGGSNPPTTGWVTLETVHDNRYHSRQHVVTMKGYNWLRINITTIDGSAENYDAVLNMDIYDASTALADDWIFFGDSITAGAMGHQTMNGTVAFAQLINAHAPSYYPVQEAGGIAFLTSYDGLQNLNTWLQLFPGRYVGLSYGTNDALDCINHATFYNNYMTMVQDILSAGKIPVVPYIPWGRKDTIQQCAPALNTQITKLYGAFHEIVHGPNLWSFFQSHQNLISNDNVHPTNAGFGAYRQEWANAMLTAVYDRSNP